MNTSLEKGLRSAEAVQQALLPKKHHFEKMFVDSFVLYHPKESLSGDFYWVGQCDNQRFIVVGDCSGHGISASLITVLMLNLFNDIIMNQGITAPNEVLNALDTSYIQSFSGNHEVKFDNPWVDLSIIVIDDDKKEISYSSANRKLLHVRTEQSFDVYKSNGYSIGGWKIGENREFTSVTFPFLEGDKLYIGSDGFQDQFGGINTKKFGSKKLHQLLCSQSHFSFAYQKEKLSDTLISWRKNEPQTDDICVIGVKL